MGDHIRVVLGLVASVLEANGFRATLQVLSAESVQLGHGDPDLGEFSQVSNAYEVCRSPI